MAVTDRRDPRAPRAPQTSWSIARLIRCAALCLLVASSGACSFVEELGPGDAGYTPDSASRVTGTVGGGGSTGSGGGGSTGSGGGGSTGSGGGGSNPAIPAVVPYAATWLPSPTQGVTGYELEIRLQSGGTYRTLDIPVAYATRLSSGRLGYEVDLETNRDYVLTMRAYGGATTSDASNSLYVYGIQLVAMATGGASAATTASAATAQPTTFASGLADPSGVATSTVASSGADGTTTGSGGLDGAQADDGDTAAARNALEVVEAAWTSLDFDGSGAHLVGSLDDRLGGAPVTVTSWLRPVLDGETHPVARILDDAARAWLAVDVFGDGHVSVRVGDAAGAPVAHAEFANALEHDVWQHVAVVVDTEAAVPVRLVVGNVELAPTSVTASNAVAMPARLVGSLHVGGHDGAGFVGRIGHTAVFARTVSLAELDGVDLAGHGIDLRHDLEGGAPLHYWRIGDAAGMVPDLGAAAWPADLVATADGLVAVEDAPLPVE